MPTSSVASYGHPTPVSSVSRTVKYLNLLSCAKTVSVLAAVWPFENTQDPTVYNEFLEMASDNEE